MRTIRASEIGAYLFCQRAWWYIQQGHKSENTPQLTAGTGFHYQHGRQVLGLGCLRFLAYCLIFMALALGAMYLTRILIAS